jgi:hypothetical protein
MNLTEIPIPARYNSSAVFATIFQVRADLAPESRHW